MWTFLKSMPNSRRQATDFGLSVYFKGGEFFKDIVGSAYYVAPEVLRKRYNHEADIWSAGVILYILLSGVPPFWGNTEQEIFDSVLRGKPEFESDPWPKISEPAKNLVRKMLQPVSSEMANLSLYTIFVSLHVKACH
jgi:calcium-dependent protein kinase